jgi:hypothetical protein
MRRKQATLSASKVTTGDHLILKSEDNLLPDEKFKYSIHQTFSGLSNDSTFVTDIEVSRELTLAEFKDVLMDIPSVESQMEGLPPDHLRLRSKIHSGFFGQILRSNEQVGGGKSKSPPRPKTLKQLNIKDRSSLVI